MNEYSEYKKQYVKTPEAWYADALKPDRRSVVMFGFYAEEGGTAGEMAMRWHNLGPCHAPRLEVFDDAWGALNAIEGFLPALAEWTNLEISMDDFCDLLDSLGFEDATEREAPR